MPAGDPRSHQRAHMTRDQWIVIGISGVTCGGKTTLADRLLHEVSRVHVYHQDRYFYPDDSPHHVRCANLPHNNYDTLGALDMAAMTEHVRATMRGERDAHEHAAGPRALHVPGKSVMVIEGFTVLNYEPIAQMCDLSYYLVLDYETCLSRRVFRLYDPPDVPGYFEECVWPEHVRYRHQIETAGRARILDGTRPDILSEVLSDLRALGAEPEAQPPHKQGKP